MCSPDTYVLVPDTYVLVLTPMFWYRKNPDSGEGSGLEK